MRPGPIKNVGEIRMQTESLAKRIRRNKKGFTLVELIVVLIIVAIIAAIAVPTFLGFMDMAKNNERKNNAIKSLTATQTALSDLYADASSSLNPTKRKNVEDLVDVTGSSFMVWTKNQLLDGTTKALPENIASYTIDRALYFEGGQFVSDGSQLRTFHSNWVNIDNRIGIIAIGENDEMAFGDRQLINSIQTARLYPAYSNSPRQASRVKRKFYYFTGQTAQQTQQMFRSLRSSSIP